MYHDILLPTDGSALSRLAVAGGIELARQSGARVHGYYVVPLLPPPALEGMLHLDPALPERQLALFERLGEDYLAYVQRSADAAGVPCECRMVRGSSPHALILLEAKHKGCDLIYMASHGWDHDDGRLLGSVTLRVLNSSPVPVLVHKSNVMISHPYGAEGA